MLHMDDCDTAKGHNKGNGQHSLAAGFATCMQRITLKLFRNEKTSAKRLAGCTV